MLDATFGPHAQHHVQREFANHRVPFTPALSTEPQRLSHASGAYDVGFHVIFWPIGVLRAPPHVTGVCSVQCCGIRMAISGRNRDGIWEVAVARVKDPFAPVACSRRTFHSALHELARRASYSFLAEWRGSAPSQKQPLPCHFGVLCMKTLLWPCSSPQNPNSPLLQWHPGGTAVVVYALAFPRVESRWPRWCCALRVKIN